MSTTPEHQVEIAFGAGALGDTSSATTSASTDTANSIVCPDSAALRATTLLDVRMKLSLSDWTPATPQIICQKDGGTNNRGWTLQVESNGMRWSQADPAHTNALGTTFLLSIPAFADGTAHWLRFVAVAKTGAFASFAGTGLWLAVYTSKNGNTWTPYKGIDGTGEYQTAGLPNMNPSTGDLAVRSSDHTAGTVTFYAFSMLTQQASTPAASLDLDNRWASTDVAWTDRVGNTWTAGAAITLASQWADVTADWRGSATVAPMGRASLLDVFASGSMNFTLDNADRKYDRKNAAGPYFGKLISRVPCRWRSRFGGVVYNVFRGVTTGGWPQSYDAGNHDATVAVSATDTTVILADAPTPDAALDAEMAVDAATSGGLAGWWKLNGNRVLRDLSGNGRDLTVSGGPADADPIVWGSNSRALVLADNQNAQRASAVVTAYPLTVEAWFQSSAAQDYSTAFTGTVTLLQLLSSSGSVLFNLDVEKVGTKVQANGYTQSPTAGFDSNSAVRILDGKPHHIAVVMTSTSAPASVYIDGVALVATTDVSLPGSLSGVTAVRVGTTGAALPATVDQVAIWSRKLAVSEIQRHNLIGKNGRGVETVRDRTLFVLEGAGWPGHLTDLDQAANTRCQAYIGTDSKALDYLRVVEQTERGELFLTGAGMLKLRRVEANFNDARSTTAQNTWSEDKYLADGFGIQNDDDRIVNTADVTRVGGGKSEAANATSVGLYGPRSFSVTGALNVSDTETQAAAEFYVWIGKDQVDRVDSLPVKPDDNPTDLWPRVLGAQIGDLQTVVRTPQGVGSAIDLDAHLEGVSYTFTAGFESTASLAMANQEADRNVIAWGSWAWDDGKVWGP